MSIAELGSVALTVLGFKSDSETFFFHKSLKKPSPLRLGFFWNNRWSFIKKENTYIGKMKTLGKVSENV